MSNISDLLLPPANEVLPESNVFSLGLSVILFGAGGGVSHLTITYDVLDLTIQGPAPQDMFRLVQLEPHCTGTSPSLTGPLPLLVTSGGQDWRPVQICSLDGPLLLPVLTTGDWSGQTGGTNPTRMLCCFEYDWNLKQMSFSNQPPFMVTRTVS